SIDDEDNDNEVQRVNVEGEKMDEEATNVQDEGNVNLEERDAEMTDVPLPNIQATQELEDTHVTLTPVKPDGQQQSSSISSGFVSNMLNPNQDTGVDAIFAPKTKATSLVDVHVTAIAEPSFLATTLPLTSSPFFSHQQQTPILTPATFTSSLLHDLPNFGYLANKMKEAVDIAVQLKFDRIREEAQAENQ
ncbi:hypothetical protein Tco_1058862, partial [Tanacetum coccineum]